MVKTTLMFFDSKFNSGNLGTRRGAISFLVFAVVFSVYVPIVMYINNIKHPLHLLWSQFILALLLASAVAVQLPSSDKEVLLYSGLMSLVVSTSYICLRSLNTGKIKKGDFIFIPFISGATLLSGFITYRVSRKSGLYDTKIQRQAKQKKI